MALETNTGENSGRAIRDRSRRLDALDEASGQPGQPMRRLQRRRRRVRTWYILVWIGINDRVGYPRWVMDSLPLESVDRFVRIVLWNPNPICLNCMHLPD